MKDFITKLNNNKVFKIFKKIFSAILTILLVLIFFVVLVQKITDNQINLGGYGIYTVVTGSMEPDYQVKDLILASKKDPKTIEVGEDVVYKGKEGSLNGKIIIHRVIDKYDSEGKAKFVTKGISNGISDPEIDESQILGVVKHKMPILSFCSHTINNIYGLILLIVVPLVIFIFMEGKRAIDEAYKE